MNADLIRAFLAHDDPTSLDGIPSAQTERNSGLALAIVAAFNLDAAETATLLWAVEQDRFSFDPDEMDNWYPYAAFFDENPAFEPYPEELAAAHPALGALIDGARDSSQADADAAEALYPGGPEGGWAIVARRLNLTAADFGGK